MPTLVRENTDQPATEIRYEHPAYHTRCRSDAIIKLVLFFYPLWTDGRSVWELFCSGYEPLPLQVEELSEVGRVMQKGIIVSSLTSIEFIP